MRVKRRGLLYLMLTVAVVAGPAYAAYSWQHAKLAKVQNQNRTLSARNVQLQAEIRQAAPSAVDTQTKLPEALQLVTAFYSKYSASTGTGGDTRAALIKQYGTTNLAFYNQYYQHGFDNILCAQMKPARISVSGGKIADNIATAVVTESYDSGDKAITVKVVNQGGLKIDAVSCPGSQGSLPAAPGMN